MNTFKLALFITVLLWSSAGVGATVAMVVLRPDIYTTAVNPKGSIFLIMVSFVVWPAPLYWGLTHPVI